MPTVFCSFYLHRIEGLSKSALNDSLTIRKDNLGTDRDQHLATIDYYFSKVGAWA